MVYSGGLFAGRWPVFGSAARDPRSDAPNRLPGAICPAHVLINIHNDHGDSYDDLAVRQADACCESRHRDARR